MAESQSAETVAEVPVISHPEPLNEAPNESHPPTPTNDQTTLLQNEEESFALAPVDTSVLKGCLNFIY